MSAATSTPRPTATRPLSTPGAGAETCRWRSRLIADLVRAPQFDEAELEREKEVVCQELGEAATRPATSSSTTCSKRRLHRPAARPLGARRRGEHRRITRRGPASGWLARSVSRRTADRWSPPARSIPAMVLLAEALFGDLDRPPPPPIEPAEFTGGVAPTGRAEQAHLALGFPGLPASDQAYPRGCSPTGGRRRHVVAAVPGTARGAGLAYSV